MATCLPYSERKCRRCIYDNEHELDKPCIVYSEECKLFKPKEIEPEEITVYQRAIKEVAS